MRCWACGGAGYILSQGLYEENWRRFRCPACYGTGRYLSDSFTAEGRCVDGHHCTLIYRHDRRTGAVWMQHGENPEAVRQHPCWGKNEDDNDETFVAWLRACHEYERDNARALRGEWG